VHHICSDWRKAALSPANVALCAYAEKLTKTPQQMSPADLDVLRGITLSPTPLSIPMNNAGRNLLKPIVLRYFRKIMGFIVYGNMRVFFV